MSQAAVQRQIPRSAIANLNQGFTFQSLGSDFPYEVQRKLGNGGEGHTYLVLDAQGEAHTLKIVEGKSRLSGESLEAKVSSELSRVNKALGRSYSTTRVNELDVAIIGDFVEGENLKQHVASRQSVYGEHEVVDFLVDILERDVNPLHSQGLVHRDIKPENIVASLDEEGAMQYSLIDFGTLREHDKTATLTATFQTTLGYGKIKARYEASDDLYSLAKTSYFLLTGQDPEFVGHDRYDAINDQEIFGAIPMKEELRQILFKMLGHDDNNTFTSTQDALDELKELQETYKGSTKNENVGMDLESSTALVRYREASVVPIDLRRRVVGLKARFSEKYGEAHASRVELDATFVSDLEKALTDLGYVSSTITCLKERKEKWAETIGKESFDRKKYVISKYEVENVFLRKRRDSTSVDVFRILSGEEGRYFDYFVARNETKITELASEFIPSHDGYEAAYVSNCIALAGVGASIAYTTTGGNLPMTALGALGGFTAGFIHLGITMDTSDSNKRVKANGLNRHSSLWWGVMGITYPHVAGKLLDGMENLFLKNKHSIESGKNLDDVQRLKRALEPAALFTYKQLED